MGTQKRIAIMIHIMSPEIFPMFTEAIGDIIFIGSTVLSNFPDVSCSSVSSWPSPSVALFVVNKSRLRGIVASFL